MTEERVIPGQTNVINVCKHIARYNFILPYCERANVIDAACGSGYGSWLISQVAKEVYGMDIDKKAIELAKDKYQRSNIKFNEQDITKMGDVYGKADVFVSFETVEHLDDLEQLETLIWDKLKADGLFIYSVPLNEQTGQNKYHKHTFFAESAAKVFPHFQILRSYVQEGVNFSDPAETTPRQFQYFVAICSKRPDFDLAT